VAAAFASLSRADFLYAFSVFEFKFACLAWFAVHLIRLALYAESAREMEANAIQQNQASQAADGTSQAKSAASEQKQKCNYGE
jgi:hypothetical protein